jgi:hypothetical protein
MSNRPRHRIGIDSPRLSLRSRPHRRDLTGARGHERIGRGAADRRSDRVERDAISQASTLGSPSATTGVRAGSNFTGRMPLLLRRRHGENASSAAGGFFCGLRVAGERKREPGKRSRKRHGPACGETPTAHRAPLEGTCRGPDGPVKLRSDDDFAPPNDVFGSPSNLAASYWFVIDAQGLQRLLRQAVVDAFGSNRRGRRPYPHATVPLPRKSRNRLGCAVDVSDEAVQRDPPRAHPPS